MRTIEIVHRTRYEYAELVTLGEYRLMFRPRDSHDLRLLHTDLAISPTGSIRWVHDAFGNSIAIASFTGSAQALEFISTIRLEHFGTPPEVAPIEAYAVKLPFSYPADEAPDLARYIERQYPDPDAALSLWAKDFLESEGGDTFATLSRMCGAIHETFAYGQRFEPGTQPPATTLEQRSGTCRDFALLMMEGARSLGLAARFVSGYLYDPALDLEPGVDSAPAQPHAWMEFNPTNGIIGTDRLIRVAVARDSEQAMPIKGSFTGAPGACVSTVVDVQVHTLPAGTPPAVVPVATAAIGGSVPLQAASMQVLS